MGEETMSETREHVPSGNMPDAFDLQLGQYDGLPDVVRTKEITKRVVPFMGVGGVQTFIIQTIRQGDKHTIFLEHVAEGKVVRLAIPPDVADVIARQRDSLSTKLRRKIGKANAQERKAQGLKPGFQMSAEERAAAKRARRKAK
jgi:hypothetical protein